MNFLSKYLYLYLIFPSQKNYPPRSALTNKTNVIPLRTKTFQKHFFPVVLMNGIELMTGTTITPKLGMLNQLNFSKR